MEGKPWNSQKNSGSSVCCSVSVSIASSREEALEIFESARKLPLPSFAVSSPSSSASSENGQSDTRRTTGAEKGNPDTEALRNIQQTHVFRSPYDSNSRSSLKLFLSSPNLNVETPHDLENGTSSNGDVGNNDEELNDDDFSVVDWLETSSSTTPMNTSSSISLANTNTQTAPSNRKSSLRHSRSSVSSAATVPDIKNYFAAPEKSLLSHEIDDFVFNDSFFEDEQFNTGNLSSTKVTNTATPVNSKRPSSTETAELLQSPVVSKSASKDIISFLAPDTPSTTATSLSHSSCNSRMTITSNSSSSKNKSIRNHSDDVTQASYDDIKQFISKRNQLASNKSSSNIRLSGNTASIIRPRKKTSRSDISIDYGSKNSFSDLSIGVNESGRAEPEVSNIHEKVRSGSDSSLVSNPNLSSSDLTSSDTKPRIKKRVLVKVRSGIADSSGSATPTTTRYKIKCVHNGEDEVGLNDDRAIVSDRSKNIRRDRSTSRVRGVARSKSTDTGLPILRRAEEPSVVPQKSTELAATDVPKRRLRRHVSAANLDPTTASFCSKMETLINLPDGLTRHQKHNNLLTSVPDMEKTSKSTPRNLSRHNFSRSRSEPRSSVKDPTKNCSVKSTSVKNAKSVISATEVSSQNTITLGTSSPMAKKCISSGEELLGKQKAQCGSDFDRSWMCLLLANDEKKSISRNGDVKAEAMTRDQQFSASWSYFPIVHDFNDDSFNDLQNVSDSNLEKDIGRRMQSVERNSFDSVALAGTCNNVGNATTFTNENDNKQKQLKKGQNKRGKMKESQNKREQMKKGQNKREQNNFNVRRTLSEPPKKDNEAKRIVCAVDTVDDIEVQPQILHRSHKARSDTQVLFPEKKATRNAQEQSEQELSSDEEIVSPKAPLIFRNKVNRSASLNGLRLRRRACSESRIRKPAYSDDGLERIRHFKGVENVDDELKTDDLSQQANENFSHNYNDNHELPTQRNSRDKSSEGRRGRSRNRRCRIACVKLIAPSMLADSNLKATTVVRSRSRSSKVDRSKYLNVSTHDRLKAADLLTPIISRRPSKTPTNRIEPQAIYNPDSVIEKTSQNHLAGEDKGNNKHRSQSKERFSKTSDCFLNKSNDEEKTHKQGVLYSNRVREEPYATQNKPLSRSISRDRRKCSR